MNDDVFTAYTPLGAVAVEFPEDGGCLMSGDALAIDHLRSVIGGLSGRMGMSLEPTGLEPDDFVDFCQPEGSGIVIVPPAWYVDDQPAAGAAAVLDSALDRARSAADIARKVAELQAATGVQRVRIAGELAAMVGGTIQAMSENKATGPQGDAQQGASTGNAVAGFDAQAAFEKHGGAGDVDESTNITAKSNAFADMAEAEGYTVSGRGDKYFTITKSFGKDADGYDKTAIIKVRVSDHSNVNRGYHFGDADINIAPDDGYSRDTFQDALRKIRTAYVNDDLDTIIPNDPSAPASGGAKPPGSGG